MIRRAIRRPAHEAAPGPAGLPGPALPADRRGWLGLEVAAEDRCSAYDRGDYRYAQSIRGRILAGDTGLDASPYSGDRFDSGGSWDIEHVVATSEAHDSGLCAALAPARRSEFAGDLRNLTLARPALNRRAKAGKDAAEWLPASPEGRCWFVRRVVEVKREYSLTVDQAESRALERVLLDGDCGSGPDDFMAYWVDGRSAVGAALAVGVPGRIVPGSGRRNGGRGWRGSVRSSRPRRGVVAAARARVADRRSPVLDLAGLGADAAGVSGRTGRHGFCTRGIGTTGGRSTSTSCAARRRRGSRPSTAALESSGVLAGRRTDGRWGGPGPSGCATSPRGWWRSEVSRDRWRRVLEGLGVPCGVGYGGRPPVCGLAPAMRSEEAQAYADRGLVSVVQSARIRFGVSRR